MGGLLSLFRSRKFWLVLGASLAALVLWATGYVDAEFAMTVIAGLVALLNGAIAYEDAHKHPRM